MTSVICTISPHRDHLPLSIQTLEFAKRVKGIKNKAKVNEMIDNNDLIRKYQKVCWDLVNCFRESEHLRSRWSHMNDLLRDS